MIDLGIELAGYTGELPDVPIRPDEGKAILRPVVRVGGVSLRLADLQAQGFNTTPPPGVILPGGGGQIGGISLADYWKTSDL